MEFEEFIEMLKNMMGGGGSKNAYVHRYEITQSIDGNLDVNAFIIHKPIKKGNLDNLSKKPERPTGEIITEGMFGKKKNNKTFLEGEVTN